MVEERKEYRYKEESDEPENRFWASANDCVFFDAEPLTDEEKALAAQIWDELTGGKASPGKKVLKGQPVKFASKIHENKD